VTQALVCWNCGASLGGVPQPISRHATCDQCFNELHCCRLCRHYDPQRTLQCFEDRADPPLQKENANFCEFFSPRANAFEGQRADKSEAARSRLDGLFGKPADDDAGNVDPCATPEKPALSPDELARKKLDDLFKGK
jgi:hypothetical protein